MCTPAKYADTSQVKSLLQSYSDESDLRVKKQVFWIAESNKYSLKTIALILNNTDILVSHFILFLMIEMFLIICTYGVFI
jgi:hypothetical protein